MFAALRFVTKVHLPALLFRRLNVLISVVLMTCERLDDEAHVAEVKTLLLKVAVLVRNVASLLKL